MDNNLFELVFEEELTKGVYGVSIVDDPAVGVMALTFNKDSEIEDWKFSSEDKRIIVSPILIPNQKLYRKDIMGTGSGFVFVTKETIEKLQQNYFKNQFNHNSTIEHTQEIESGVYVFESWIIQDPEKDKSKALGFDNLPAGTWMVSMKIEDESIWQDFIKSGKVNGLSIDALLKPVKIEENNNNLTFKKEKMNKSNFKIAFKKALISKLGFNAELIEVKISDEISYFVEALELGKILFDKDNTALPNVEFTYDGMVYKTNADGAIESIEEVVVENETEEFDFNDELNEVVAEVIEEIKAEVIDEKDAMIAELEAKVLELEAKLATFEKAETEKVELHKQTPASKGIQPTIKNDNKRINGVLAAMRANR